MVWVYGGPCQQPSYLALLQRGRWDSLTLQVIWGGWVGPYMLGFINGHTGSFAYGYYVMGACMFLAGLLILTLPKSMEHKED